MQTLEVAKKIKWSIDSANSQIGFRVKYLMFTNVAGTFREFSASISTEDNDFTTAEIDFQANAASIDTGNKKEMLI